MFEKFFFICFLLSINCFSSSIFDPLTKDLNSIIPPKTCLKINGFECSAPENSAFACNEEELKFTITKVEVLPDDETVAISFKFGDEDPVTLNSKLTHFPFKAVNCKPQFDLYKPIVEQIKDERPNIEVKQKITWNHQKQKLNEEWIPKLNIYPKMFFKIMGFETACHKECNQTVLFFLIGLENTPKEHCVKQEAYIFNHELLSRKRLKGIYYCDSNLRLYSVYLSRHTGNTPEYSRWAKINDVSPDTDTQKYTQYEENHSTLVGQLLLEEGQEFNGCCYMKELTSSPQGKGNFIFVLQKKGQQVFYQGENQKRSFSYVESLPDPAYNHECSVIDGQELTCPVIMPTKIKFYPPDSEEKHTQIEFCSNRVYQLTSSRIHGAAQEWQEVVGGGNDHTVEFTHPEYTEYKGFSQMDVTKGLIEVDAEGVAQSLKSLSSFSDENHKKKLILDITNLKTLGKKRLASQRFLRLFKILGLGSKKEISYHIENEFMPSCLCYTDLFFLRTLRENGNFKTQNFDLDYPPAKEAVFSYLANLENVEIGELTLPPIEDNKQNHLTILKEFLQKNQVSSLKISLSALFYQHEMTPEDKSAYQDLILELSDNNLQELFLPQGIDISALEDLFSYRNFIFRLQREDKNKLSKFLAKVKTPVVVYEGKKKLEPFLKGIIPMLENSLKIITELKLENKKLSTKQKQDLIDCVASMPKLEIFKLHLTNFNNSELVNLANSLKNKIHLKNLTFDMPAPESFGANEISHLTDLTWDAKYSDEWLLKKLFLQTTFVPIYSLPWFADDIYYAVAQKLGKFTPQGKSFDDTIKLLYKLSRLRKDPLKELVLYTQNDLNDETIEFYKNPTNELLDTPALRLKPYNLPLGFQNPKIVSFEQIK